MHSQYQCEEDRPSNNQKEIQQLYTICKNDLKKGFTLLIDQEVVILTQGYANKQNKLAKTRQPPQTRPERCSLLQKKISTEYLDEYVTGADIDLQIKQDLKAELKQSYDIDIQSINNKNKSSQKIIICIDQNSSNDNDDDNQALSSQNQKKLDSPKSSRSSYRGNKTRLQATQNRRRQFKESKSTSKRNNGDDSNRNHKDEEENADFNKMILHAQETCKQKISRSFEVNKSTEIEQMVPIQDRFKIKISKALFIQQRQGQVKDKYQICEILGKGSFGLVQKILTKATGEFKAMKMIRKEQVTEEYMKILMDEIEILGKLDHPNILKIYEFYQDKEKFYLITELIEGGDLSDYIKKHRHINEKTAACIIYQLLETVNYCHINKVAHRDLKPENIMLQSKECLQIKLIDFGTSVRFDINPIMNSRIGTPHYIAPEVLKRNYNEKCDIWSCGVILYQLLSGHLPFRGKNQLEIFQNIREHKLNLSVPELREISIEGKLMIKKLLNPNPKERITAEEALKDAWFSHYDKIHQSKAEVINKYRDYIQKMIENISHLRVEKKLQQAVLSYFINFTNIEANSKATDEIFRALDKDGNGQLGKNELVQGFSIYFNGDISKADLFAKEMLLKLDLSGSGKLEYSEFLIAGLNPQILLEEERIQEIFKLFDQNNSGEISAKELQKVLGRGLIKAPDLDESNEWDQMISEIDLQGEGEVCYQDFKRMMYMLFNSDKIKVEKHQFIHGVHTQQFSIKNVNMNSQNESPLELSMNQLKESSQGKKKKGKKRLVYNHVIVKKRKTNTKNTQEECNVEVEEDELPDLSSLNLKKNMSHHISSNGGNVVVDAFIDSHIDISRLDDVFQLSYSFDKLTAILKVLIYQSKQHNDHINTLFKQTALMDKFRSDQKTMKDQMKGLTDKLSNQDDSLQSINSNFSNLKLNLDDTCASLESTKSDQDLHLERIEKLENELVLAKDEHETNLNNIRGELSGIKDSHITKKQHEERQNDLKKEFNNHISNHEESLQRLRDRIKQLEIQVPEQGKQIEEQLVKINQLNEKQSDHDTIIDKQRADIASHSNQIQDHLGMLKELQKKLQEKVGCEIFDKEINYLKSMLTHLRNKQNDDAKFLEDKEKQKQNTVEIGSKELNLLREIEEKLPMIEDKLREIMEQTAKIPRIEDYLQKLANQLKELNLTEIIIKIKALETGKLDKDPFYNTILEMQDTLKEHSNMLNILDLRGASGGSDGLIGLTQKIEVIFKRMSDLEKEMGDLRKAGRTSNNIQINESVNQSEVDALKELINQLKKEIESMRAAFAKQLKELEKQLKLKVDHNQLSQLEKLFMDQLNEQMNILNSKIDDLKKLKQQMAKLEAAMKKLQDFVMEQLAQINGLNLNGHRGEEEDAMFAKRPLQGWSCASCDKDILNLSGKPADYFPWMKMPPRDPTDRISRVGQGFSRMLSQVKPEFIERLKKQRMNQTLTNIMAADQSIDELSQNSNININQSPDNAYQNKPTSSQSKASRSQNRSKIGRTQLVNSSLIHQQNYTNGSQTERGGQTTLHTGDTPQFRKNLMRNIQSDSKMIKDMTSPLREKAQKLTLQDNLNEYQLTQRELSRMGVTPGSKSHSTLPPVLTQKTPQKKQ